jgi:hypothetical protein
MDAGMYAQPLDLSTAKELVISCCSAVIQMLPC